MLEHPPIQFSKEVIGAERFQLLRSMIAASVHAWTGRMWLSVVVGVAALLLAALTDHPTGLVRVIPYWLHLWVDRAVRVVFVIAPFAFKFVGLDAWYYWVLAAAVPAQTSVFNAPGEPVATRSGLDTRAAG